MPNLGVGIVGCGIISRTYLRNAPLFRGVEVRAVADVVPAAARARSEEFGVRALSVDDLLASKDVDVVVNLTVPNAHYAVSMAALKAGKHVFTEKPLAATAALGRKLVAAAKANRRAIASAPDTFLGPAGRKARALIEAGAIGKPLSGTAFVMSHGMEHWHPNPDFFFKPGGGPVLDLGPYYITQLVNLLGPVRRILASTTIGNPHRTVTAEGPNVGKRIKVETPTTAHALLEFAGGARVILGMSWDVWRHGMAPIEIHGTEGSMRVPDPNFFGGIVEVARGRGEWERHDSSADAFGAPNHPPEKPVHANYRVLGIAELAEAIRARRASRLSGDVALHVLEVMEGVLSSGARNRAITLPATRARPGVMTEDEARALAAD